MHDVAGAQREYEEAVRLRLASPGLYGALGVTREAMGDTAGAQAALRKAVKAEPRLAVAWRELGVLAEKGSHWTEARRLYERALAAEPDGADTLFDHARVCLRLGIGRRPGAARSIS